MKRILAAMLTCAVTTALANEADVLKVAIDCGVEGMCDFAVTVEHGDDGWDHYADRWEILGGAGELIATRVLAHPHDHEQPFTRVLGGVRIPAGLRRVTVRAHDSVHGYGGKEVVVELGSKDRGPGAKD
jgi:hypothetical protein